jgi:hypothetical protein
VWSNAERLLVQVPQVVDVDVVLDEQLPVELAFDATARDLREEPRAEAADVLRQRAERRGERWGRGIGVHEHEPFPRVDRCGEQAARGEVEIGELTRALRHDFEVAAGRELPPVIRAAQSAALGSWFGNEQHAAMATGVVERAPRSVGLDDDDELVAAGGHGHRGARLHEILGRGDERPRPLEDLLRLVPQPPGIGIRARIEPDHRTLQQAPAAYVRLHAIEGVCR